MSHSTTSTSTSSTGLNGGERARGTPPSSNDSNKDENAPIVQNEEELRAAAPLLRGRRLTTALAFVAGTGFTLFGYVAAVFNSHC